MVALLPNVRRGGGGHNLHNMNDPGHMLANISNLLVFRTRSRMILKWYGSFGFNVYKVCINDDLTYYTPKSNLFSYTFLWGQLETNHLKIKWFAANYPTETGLSLYENIDPKRMSAPFPGPCIGFHFCYLKLLGLSKQTQIWSLHGKGE